MTGHTSTDTLVIGTGFSGLGMAIGLKQAGRDDLVILEKAHDVGGTWRDNTYPGCACDIPSHMYSFSYEQNPDWTRSYSTQPEIWDYLLRVTDENDLRRHICFGTEVTGAQWHEDEQRWYVHTTGGDTYDTRVLVSGIGALHVPNVPDLPGQENFAGPAFHSAQWDHDVDLTGRRVAVVGTGASAIQFVPQIVDQVAHLDIYQRTAPWIMPKPDHPMNPSARAAFARVPGLLRAYRNLLYWILESRALGFNGHPKMLRMAEGLCRRFIAKQVKDPRMRRKLTPDYRLGCKRVLMANDYFPVFDRDNVALVTDGVKGFTAGGVIGNDGKERPADVVIFGTGFHVVDGFQHLNIVGLDGRDLAKRFDEFGVETYLGINVSGFPNLFFLLGPNTGLGHNSVVFMIEQQTKYVLRVLTEMDARGANSVDVGETAQKAFNTDVQQKLINGIWTTGGCTSWYLDSQGVNRTIWPGFTWKYWLDTRKVDRDAYEWIPA